MALRRELTSNNMKISLAKRIVAYVRRNGKTHGGEIERLASGAGFKGSTASRRCREMASGKKSNGDTCPILLKADKDEKGRVWYEYIERPKENPNITVVVKEDGTKVALMK